jgi:cytochrome c peroxidase
MLKQPVRNSIYSIVIIFLLLVTVDACNTIPEKKNADNFRDLIPAWIKDSVYLSGANPFSAEKAKMGRYFFYDRRLSVNQSKACASCHAPNFSFTDGYRRSIGALGDNVQRNAPTLINIVFNKYLTAADSTLHFPEQQINNPMFHYQPVELGWKGNEHIIIDRLKKDSLYNRRLPMLFPGDREPFTIKNIQDCITSFIKTILSFEAPYDRYIYNKDTTALSAAQIRGMKLFFSNELHCSNCHGGINFSTPALTDKSGNPDYYQNTGLYNINSKGAYPVNDCGLFELTRQPADIGKFRVPTLRNLAFTAPYLHDGTAAGLEDIIAIYQNGGRNITTGASRGDGRKNQYKNPLIQGFIIKEQEKKDLIGFLLSLSDSSSCNNPVYSNPFTRDETHP